MNTSRRDVLIGGVFAGGALLVGPFSHGAKASGAPGNQFGPFVRIESDGIVTVVAKFSELGQGAQSGMAALVAEELDADWSQVRVVSSPAEPRVYQRGKSGRMITGGSNSIADSWMQLRSAGAAARAMFVGAAAQIWNVPASEIGVRNGIVSHAKSGRSLGFGPLVERASRQTPIVDPALKHPQDYTLIGTNRAGRLDARAKSTGTTIYTQDVRLPGMLVAMVAHSPRFGGRVKSFDDAATKAIPGVVAVYQIPSGVAVVARSTYAARLARDALKVTWDDSAAEMRGTEAIAAEYRAIADVTQKADWFPVTTKGSMAGAFDESAITLSVDFPYLAHAAMEPMNCVAQVDGQRVRLTFGCQSHTADQKAAAAIVGGTADQVEIVTLPAGGSFGRRSVSSSDYQKEAVEIAKRVGGFIPVKLVWAREDDMTGGYYRPLTHHRARIAVGAEGYGEDGYPISWEHRLVSASLVRGTPNENLIRDGVDTTVVEGVRGSPYLAAAVNVDAQVCSPPSKVPVLWLRSVGATHSAFAMEHFVDQLARRANVDPVAYRRELYRRGKAERHLAVLDLAAQKAHWGRKLPKGRALGIAVHECFGTVVANVAEVSVNAGIPKVHKVTCALDCGFAVSPDQVRAQMEGGIAYGLSFALFGEVRLKEGIVETANFDSYRVLRMEEMPEVDVHILPSDKSPTGAGEPGTPVVGPAVANALLALTGKATTSLPLVKNI